MLSKLHVSMCSALAVMRWVLQCGYMLLRHDYTQQKRALAEIKNNVGSASFGAGLTVVLTVNKDKDYL